MKNWLTLACRCVGKTLKKTERYGHCVYLSAGCFEHNLYLASSCQLCLVLVVANEVYQFTFGEE